MLCFNNECIKKQNTKVIRLTNEFVKISEKNDYIL